MDVDFPVPDGVTPLIDEATIQARVTAMAHAVAEDLGPRFLMVPVLRGSFIFAADLIRALARVGALPAVEFVGLESYGDSLESSGAVHISGRIPPVAGRHVLLVDDILDTGHTLKEGRRLLEEQGARRVRLATLLDKPARREVDVTLDFCGFDVPDRFVVGYGLDARGAYRGLPCVAALG